LGIGPHSSCPNFMPICPVTKKNNFIVPVANKKASIRGQDSAPSISDYWPTSEPNAS